MLTLSLKSETTNANGKMNPCHSPSQKPATEPSAPGEFLKRFGPAAQPAAKHTANASERPKTATSGFFTTPPRTAAARSRLRIAHRESRGASFGTTIGGGWRHGSPGTPLHASNARGA